MFGAMQAQNFKIDRSLQQDLCAPVQQSEPKHRKKENFKIYKYNSLWTSGQSVAAQHPTSRLNKRREREKRSKRKKRKRNRAHFRL